MAQKGCFNAVCTVLETAGISLSKDESVLAWAKSVCAIVDEMAANGEVEFMQSTMSSGNLEIELGCDFDLSLDGGRTHLFFELTNRFDELSFSKVREDRLRIVLTKGGLK